MRVESFTRAEVVLSQGLTLPLREGMNHFELGVWQCFHFHLHRFFASGQVILRPITHAAENRCLNFNQTQLLFQLAGKWDLTKLIWRCFAI